jgi:hypothetical protein
MPLKGVPTVTPTPQNWHFALIDVIVVPDWFEEYPVWKPNLRAFKWAPTRTCREIGCQMNQIGETFLCGLWRGNFWPALYTCHLEGWSRGSGWVNRQLTDTSDTGVVWYCSSVIINADGWWWMMMKMMKMGWWWWWYDDEMVDQWWMEMVDWWWTWDVLTVYFAHISGSCMLVPLGCQLTRWVLQFCTVALLITRVLTKFPAAVKLLLPLDTHIHALTHLCSLTLSLCPSSQHGTIHVWMTACRQSVRDYKMAASGRSLSNAS